MGMNEWELGWAVQAGQLREALHLADVADRIRLQLQSVGSVRNLPSDAKPSNAPVCCGRSMQASNPGSAAVAVDREAVASSTPEQSRYGGCNKAATAVATKPLQRWQQPLQRWQPSRYSGGNQAATAVATKPLRRLQQSRYGGCNKAATAVATKPLQRLQPSRYSGCNKPLQRLQPSRYSGCNQAATAVATKPLRRLRKPLQLQLVTAALHVPPSVAGAAR
jgi:hypothetical protein